MKASTPKFAKGELTSIENEVTYVKQDTAESNSINTQFCCFVYNASKDGRKFTKSSI